jgi:diamine N-acetyltransferase
MISYFETDETELDLINELWEKLKHHHQLRSKNFPQNYLNIHFEDRKDELIKKSNNGNLRLDLALDITINKVVGYCISSFSYENGEIDSIYIEKKFRMLGIGDTIMKRALSWMDSNNVENIEVKISVGNNVAMKFYNQYSFHPKHIILKQLKNENNTGDS